MALLSSQASQALRLSYVELFVLVGRMRDGEIPSVRAVELREWADGQLKRQRRELMLADVDDAVINDAELAVIALLDESAQNSRSRDFAEPWMRSTLQLEHYRHNNL